jgi:hypothetical protein
MLYHNKEYIKIILSIIIIKTKNNIHTYDCCQQKEMEMEKMLILRNHKRLYEAN